MPQSTLAVPGGAFKGAVTMRLHTASMKAALLGLALLAPAATAAGAEERDLWFRTAERRDLARQITRLGLDCQELRGATLVEQRADGRHIRAVCGSSPGEPDAAVFRLVAGGSGLVRAEPWMRAFAGDPSLGLRPLLP